MTTHVVVKGETLAGIAKKYNVTESAIRAANCELIDNAVVIRAGWVLNIPSGIDYAAVGQCVTKVFAQMDKIPEIHKLMELIDNGREN